MGCDPGWPLTGKKGGTWIKGGRRCDDGPPRDRPAGATYWKFALRGVFTVEAH